MHALNKYSQLIRNDEGMSTIEYAMGSLAAAALAGVLYMVINGGGVDMAGAAARSHAIGVEYHPAREDTQVSVEENGGLVRASVSVDAPIGTMRSEAVFPAEVGGNE